MLNILTEQEFDDIVTLETVANTIYRLELIARMNADTLNYIIELGDEGNLLNTQRAEVVNGVEEEEFKIIEDYFISTNKKTTAQTVLDKIREIPLEDLGTLFKIIKILGYEDEMTDILDKNISPKGYRILNKIPKMPSTIIEKLVSSFTNLQSLCTASIEELDEVDGIGEVRAKAIAQSLRRMQEQYILKNYSL